MRQLATIGALLLAAGTVFAVPPDGAAQIRAPAGGSEIVITATRRLAGAIGSLTWNDGEFINATDHGRKLQFAMGIFAPPQPQPHTSGPAYAY